MIADTQSSMRLSDIADTVQGDWVVLAQQLKISMADINHIKSDYKTVGDQALAMLHLWVDKNKDKATSQYIHAKLGISKYAQFYMSCLNMLKYTKLGKFANLLYGPFLAYAFFKILKKA